MRQARRLYRATAGLLNKLICNYTANKNETNLLDEDESGLKELLNEHSRNTGNELTKYFQLKMIE